MSILSKSSHIGVFLLLLLLCSVCVAPVMAADKQSAVVEDGVHFLKFDTSPTKLDPQFYKNMDIGVNFVVDGNQFYWVRIGSVVSKGLTTVWWAKGVAATILFFIGLVGLYCWYLLFKRYFSTHYAVFMSPRDSVSGRPLMKALMLFFIPFYCIFGVTVIDSSATDALSDIISDITCGDYRDLVSSDGTILLKVDKVHPETNTLYLNSGVNVTRLTHLSGSGMILPLSGVSPT
jgi:hypothetical protein